MAFFNALGVDNPVTFWIRFCVSFAIIGLVYSLVQLVQVRYKFWMMKRQGVVSEQSEEARDTS